VVAVRRHARTLALLAACCWAPALGDTAEPKWQHGLSFYGDFKYPPGFAHFDYVDPDAPKGGKLVRAIGTNFNSFTPFIAKGISAPGIDVIIEPALYDSLLRPSGDEIGVYYGNLAGEVAPSADMKEVRMRLRPEARWHDGVPVSAHDVKFTFEHIRDHAFPGVKAAYLSLKEVHVVNAREVLFEYHFPVNLNAMMALGKVAILPEHYWRERDITQTTTQPPVSSGPYRISSFELGSYVEFERVEDYWGKDLGLHRGSFNLDVLRYEVYRDATVQREAFRKGLLDTFIESSAVEWVTGYSDHALVEQVHHNFQHYVGVISALAFNLTYPRFQDVRVREALTLAFDFEWMNRVLDYGVYDKPQSYFHGTFLAAAGLPSDDEIALLEPFRGQLPARVFTEPPFNGNSTTRLGRRDALIRAQALLEKAGWRYSDGALVDTGGERFNIEFLVAAQGGQRARLPYADQLRRLGIDASVRLVEVAQYINLRRDNKGDAVAGSLAIAMPPNQEVPAYLASTSRGNANFAHLSSPVVDALIEYVLAAESRAELMTASRALDRVLYWQFYFIPLRTVGGVRIVMWDKYAKPSVQSRDLGGFPSTWWWDPEKAVRVNRATGKD
jgi:microcin C transport system substrate-binding protein